MVIPYDLVHKCKVRVWRGKGVPRGVLLGILGRDVPPGSSNPNPISDPQKCNFPHPFSD